MSIQTGRCLCEEVELEVHADPISCGRCHCLQCQKNCGGSPSTFLMLPANAVKLTKGELRYYDTIADSGNKISRGFAPIAKLLLCQNWNAPTKLLS